MTAFGNQTFTILVDNKNRGTINKGVSLFLTTTNMVEYHEGAGWNLLVKKIPADSDNKQVTFRGVLDNAKKDPLFFWKWYNDVMNNSPFAFNKKRDITIKTSVTDADNKKKVLELSLSNAWPQSYTINSIGNNPNVNIGLSTRNVIAKANDQPALNAGNYLFQDIVFIYNGLSIEIVDG